MTVEPGAPWGRPTDQPPDLEVEGDDSALSVALARHPGARIRFVPGPDSDLARALGLPPARSDRRPGRRPSDPARASGPTIEAQLDAFEVRTVDAPSTELTEPGEILGVNMLGVNMLVLGAAPTASRWWGALHDCVVEVDGRPWFEGRATGVVVANGQYLHGCDVVPRGHPGDGRLEAHVYAVPRPQRRELRRRLPVGSHLPHPAIRATGGQAVRVRWARARPLELDGRRRAPARAVQVTIRPGILTLVLSPPDCPP